MSDLTQIVLATAVGFAMGLFVALGIVYEHLRVTRRMAERVAKAITKLEWGDEK